MEFLEIKYKVRDSFGWVRSEGHMKLIIAGFFPCTKSKFKKLLKIIDMSEEKDEILKQLQLAFPERVDQLKTEEANLMESRKEYVKDYFAEKQKVVDLTTKLKAGKYPNGVGIPVYLRANMKEELKDHKERMKTAEGYYKEKMREAKRVVKKQIQMKELMQFLNQYLQMG